MLIAFQFMIDAVGFLQTQSVACDALVLAFILLKCVVQHHYDKITQLKQ